jgi:hypothetical protein
MSIRKLSTDNDNRIESGSYKNTLLLKSVRKERIEIKIVSFDSILFIYLSELSCAKDCERYPLVNQN